MGDRVAVMDRGVLQQIGTPRTLYHEPANLFVAGFIGSPAMNLLERPARQPEERPGARPRRPPPRLAARFVARKPGLARYHRPQGRGGHQDRRR